jgi:hypothetical protein
MRKAARMFAVQRLQLTGFGPRGKRGTKRIRRRAEVRSNAELAAFGERHVPHERPKALT